MEVWKDWRCAYFLVSCFLVHAMRPEGFSFHQFKFNYYAALIFFDTRDTSTCCRCSLATHNGTAHGCIQKWILTQIKIDANEIVNKYFVEYL